MLQQRRKNLESRAEQSRAEQSRAEQSRAEQSRAERIEWIDEAKGIGIVLVMLGHCYLHWKFCFWFYAFHMPLFFTLSGYTFSGKGKFADYLKKKARTLLVPYIFFVIITMCCNGALAVTHGNEYHVFETLKLYIVQNRYTLLWFIPCLFLANLLMYVLQSFQYKRKTNRFWLIVGCIGALVFGIYRVIIGKDLPWNADLAILAMAFMSLGKWCREQKIIEKVRLMRYSLAICIIITFCVSAVNYIYFDRVDLNSDAFGNPILFMTAALTGTLAVVLISMMTDNRILIELGKNSLIYYGLHKIIIDLMFVVYGKMGIQIDNASWSAVGFAIISVFVAIVILTPVKYLVLKYIPWCLGKKKG